MLIFTDNSELQIEMLNKRTKCSMNYYQMWLKKKKNHRSCVDSARSEINTMYWNPYFYTFIMHFVLKLKYVYIVMSTHTHVCVHVCADMSACVHVECMVHPLKF